MKTEHNNGANTQGFNCYSDSPVKQLIKSFYASGISQQQMQGGWGRVGGRGKEAMLSPGSEAPVWWVLMDLSAPLTVSGQNRIIFLRVVRMNIWQLFTVMAGLNWRCDFLWMALPSRGLSVHDWLSTCAHGTSVNSISYVLIAHLYCNYHTEHVWGSNMVSCSTIKILRESFSWLLDSLTAFLIVYFQFLIVFVFRPGFPPVTPRLYELLSQLLPIFGFLLSFSLLVTNGFSL